MKYLSIDIETTGLDPETCQILSIGVIAEDSEKCLSFDEIPKFHCAIKHRQITGSPFAINMNKELIGNISDYTSSKSESEKLEIEKRTGMLFLEQEEVAKRLFYFLYDYGYIERENTEDWSHAAIVQQYETVNGKLYPMIGMKFKKVSINCAGKNFGTFDKKFIELLPRWQQIFNIRQRIIDPSVLFTDWKNDTSLPSLGECKKRAGIEGEVTHDAIEDAWDVIMLLRTEYGGTNI
jgi:oligoribonuclease